METATAVGAGRRRIIKRPRLTRMLDESGARIVLLVAPAGYGKTTLAQEWLGEDVRRAAWYRGGPASADVAALAVGLAQATSEIAPGAGDRMRERLRATDRPEEEAQLLAEMLSEDLAEWPSDAWLAIDDYHFAMDSAAAEQFVDTLATDSPLRILITSRRRPTWASARRRLYGEVVEVDRTLLAMNDDEALDVLSKRAERPPAFLAQAEGWPAVIGLAALTASPSSPEPGLPAPLYEYFAEELFTAADNTLQQSLCQLSVLSSFSPELAASVLGTDRVEEVLAEAIQSGFMSRTSEGNYEFQPLLRNFLARKLADFDASEQGNTARRIGSHLLNQQQWDATFSLSQQQQSPDLFIDLLAAAVETLLAEGRVATLEQWLAYAAEGQISSPLLDFAEAEVAFRDGAYRKAEVLALQAARRFGQQHTSTSLSYTRAGQSAHLEGRMSTAEAHFAQARISAKSDRDLRNALWGHFLCSLEKDSAEASTILEEFAAVSLADPDEQLRVGSAKVLLALRGLSPVDPSALAPIHLLQSGKDPLIKSSALNAFTAFANYLGRYEDALEIGDHLMAHLLHYRLNFALPHAHLRLAVACRGQRKFGEALEHIRRAETMALEVTDPGHLPDSYLLLGARITRAQIELCKGRFEEAHAAVSDSPSNRFSASWVGEYYGCKALVLAVLGEYGEAREMAREAIDLTHAGEARCLALLARAVAALKQEDPTTRETLSAAYAEIVSKLSADTLVSAYRAYPPLLGEFWRLADDSAFLRQLVCQANDEALARSVGIRLSPPTSIGLLLSPREGEVKELLAEGLTNKQIAKALFISESTVKVHIRHIFEKLGVKTRTEAATKRI